ncbi:MAG: N-6 DNA methylase [Candidatus Sumerlaeota bacterium]|nr:N-6 DNA methylase [Candidatus Sumerlaeota bacterium]
MSLPWNEVRDRAIRFSRKWTDEARESAEAKSFWDGFFDVYGSLFQGVMEPSERRQTGGHYTSERDILKVARSLFLDDLREEFAAIRADRSTRRRSRLEEFHRNLRGLRFFDPACGCGNFLVITYREIRRLELEVLLSLYGSSEAQQLELNVRELCQTDMDQFYGIEIQEWPARIAEVALWLMDHQMNQEAAEAFGQNFRRLPLLHSPHIAHGNALRLDWERILPPDQCSYILGNPPFVGKQFMDKEQNEDMALVCGRIKGHGLLDYVTAWYVKAAFYVQGTRCRAAFVSTNSISQGEQAGILWEELFGHGMKIQFAHRTFAWESESRGKAHVHVVIIGFGAFDTGRKRLYDYKTLEGASSSDTAANAEKEGISTVTEVANISPYLAAGPDIYLKARSRPICPVPEIVFGNMPNDGGHLLLTPEDREEFLRANPGVAKYLRRFVGAEEFINGKERWCLWLYGENPAEFMKMPGVKKRVDAVAVHRKSSRRGTTQELANAPACFGEIRHPDCSYLLIPRVSSELRRYIPIGFLRSDIIASDACLLVPGAKVYHFGILSSVMHIAWVRLVCGRLESRYRYSNKIVYNNYPWPAEPSEARRSRVEEAARRVIELRAELGDGRAGFLPAKKKGSASACLADLYSAHGMPLELYKAHRKLDIAVDRCYRTKPFRDDWERVEFLFALYERYTAPLIAAS